ncbi:hypothetical protein [Geobacter sp. SVR]|uniref:hypothetical protein n=1 Tax=Geobacter sp. SVR TaxID=2495594 RepID=UPI00143EF69C|nr:hypothetical protein [Geobacter sp. SVR]BCS54370.1 hypothetical protein GSVR_26780 [Geobacter sp. SVR]GCF87461.1 hypothetical protein GSbR_40610 [Geobacter sp. SVR]
MRTTTLSAGDIIEARCTRCRDILNHRIVAMVGEKVVRVECNTCGGVHNYYPPPSAKSASSPRQASPRTGATARATSTGTRSVKKDPVEAEQEEWSALRPAMQVERALAYDLNGRFTANTLLNHPAFGLGIVKQVIPPNKMQVLFEDGIKLLRCQA